MSIQNKNVISYRDKKKTKKIKIKTYLKDGVINRSNLAISNQ